LLFERDTVVTYETNRCRCDTFGAGLVRRVGAARRKPVSTWHQDEMFVTLRGEAYLVWREVDEHRAKLDVPLRKIHKKAPATLMPFSEGFSWDTEWCNEQGRI
jgi:putative transposase